jgi:putative hydrolase of the HAD superfamily
MAGPYRAIFFDLDGTLIDEQAGVAEARAAVAAAMRARGHAVDDAAYSAASDAVIRDLLAANGGEWPFVWSREAVIGDTLARLGLPAAAADEMAAVYLRTRLGHVRLLDGAVAAVDWARSGHRVGLITNGPGPEQREKLRRAGLTASFESLTISGEAGAAKPDGAIFAQALASLGVEAGEAVHVGNSLAADIVGAREAGLDAVWLRAPGAAGSAGADAPDCRIITSMTELPAALSPDAAAAGGGKGRSRWPA